MPQPIFGKLNLIERALKKRRWKIAISRVRSILASYHRFTSAHIAEGQRLLLLLLRTSYPPEINTLAINLLCVWWDHDSAACREILTAPAVGRALRRTLSRTEISATVLTGWLQGLASLSVRSPELDLLRRRLTHHRRDPVVRAWAASWIFRSGDLLTALQIYPNIIRKRDTTPREHRLVLVAMEETLVGRLNDWYHPPRHGRRPLVGRGELFSLVTALRQLLNVEPECLPYETTLWAFRVLMVANCLNRNAKIPQGIGKHSIVYWRQLLTPKLGRIEEPPKLTERRLRA